MAWKLTGVYSTPKHGEHYVRRGVVCRSDDESNDGSPRNIVVHVPMPNAVDAVAAHAWGTLVRQTQLAPDAELVISRESLASMAQEAADRIDAAQAQVQRHARFDEMFNGAPATTIGKTSAPVPQPTRVVRKHVVASLVIITRARARAWETMEHDTPADVTTYVTRGTMHQRYLAALATERDAEATKAETPPANTAAVAAARAIVVRTKVRAWDLLRDDTGAALARGDMVQVTPSDMQARYLAAMEHEEELVTAIQHLDDMPDIQRMGG